MGKLPHIVAQPKEIRCPALYETTITDLQRNPNIIIVNYVEQVHEFGIEKVAFYCPLNLLESQRLLLREEIT